jgi:hypothetical protein
VVIDSELNKDRHDLIPATIIGMRLKPFNDKIDSKLDFIGGEKKSYQTNLQI